MLTHARELFGFGALKRINRLLFIANRKDRADVVALART